MSEEQQLNEGILKKAVELGKQLSVLNVKKLKTESGFNHLALIPEGMELADLSPYVPVLPERKQVDVFFSDIDSFIEYINEQKEETTRIFADTQNKLFRGIIDYHGTERGAAQWLEHSAILKLRESEEFKVWNGANNKFFNQEEFCLFLKDYRLDIAEPDGATLIEIAMTLEATAESRCVSKVRTNEGMRLDFKEDVQARAGADGALTIPDTLKIKIPLFLGTDPIELTADFKFRVNSGTVSFAFRLLGMEKVIRDSIKEAVEKIRKETETPVFEAEVRNISDSPKE
jgi:uncharacterized protein YfdQ (DUF2303 family)